MAFGPFTLQWRAPSPNPPNPNELPVGFTRSSVPTSSGSLELLSAIPEHRLDDSKPPLFFAHGGFGCAEIWIPYMQFFASNGYACYSISYRGHGNSWYPGFWSMYFTSRGSIGEDLVAGIEQVEKLEKSRREVDGNVRVILISHSAGGALSQYVLSKGLVRVHAFCMCAAVPGFGSWSVYKFWSLTAPIHFPYRFFHPRYILANSRQVHDAFFASSTPITVVRSLERLLSPYESMLWPMQSLFRFVTGPDVLSFITCWQSQQLSSLSNTMTDGLLVLAAEKDVLCTPAILEHAAQRYRAALHGLIEQKKLDGVSALDPKVQNEGSGVRFKIVPGLGHHLQNHIEWERGAVEILDWLKIF